MNELPRYGPADSAQSPRFSGPRTFMRLPHVTEIEGVDAAVLGVPTDDAVSFRSGARFGPEAVRSASALLRPFSPDSRVNLAEALSIVDFGDAPTVPGYHEMTLDRITDFLFPLFEGNVVPISIGGDHSMALGELRAASKVYGPLALVLLDAHADVWDSYFGVKYFHGTVFRRAVEEGLIDPGRSTLAGMRGTLYGESDRFEPEEMGFDVIEWAELASLGPTEFGSRARDRAGGAPAFISFDIDFVDPAFAPGTGTPEVGGPTSGEALAFLRSLAGLDMVGADCVEISPPFDSDGVTAWLGASVCHTLLCLVTQR